VKTRQWYRIVAQADSDVTELFVFDSIGKSFWDDSTVTAKQFVADLAALPESVKTIRVRVNSPGGDVFDAVAIANALRAERTEKGRTVEMSIEGLAASAATIITMAGDPIRIVKNGLVMVHNPHGFVYGTAEDMRKIAGLLDKVRDTIVATYRWHSELDAEALVALMDETTWMTAEEAIEKGFATELVEDAVKATAQFRPAALVPLGEIPAKHRATVEAWTAKPAEPTPPSPAPEPPKPAAAKDVLARCRAANLLELAEPLIEAALPLDQVEARLAAATEIRALCITAKFPELAAGYIQAAAPAAVVRAHLTTLGAKFDAIEIDGTLPPDGGTASDQKRIEESWRRAFARVQPGGTRR
jgi:ATP-dependent protease ClpP protease subunit